MSWGRRMSHRVAFRLAFLSTRTHPLSVACTRPLSSSHTTHSLPCSSSLMSGSVLFFKGLRHQPSGQQVGSGVARFGERPGRPAGGGGGVGQAGDGSASRGAATCAALTEPAEVQALPADHVAATCAVY